MAVAVAPILEASDGTVSRFRRPSDGEVARSGRTLQHRHGWGEWTIRGLPAGFRWEHSHDSGDVAVRGAAAELLLALLRRIPGDDGQLEIVGELEHWSTWLANTAF